MKVKEYATQDHTIDLSNDIPDPDYQSEYIDVDMAQGDDETAYYLVKSDNGSLNFTVLSKEDYDQYERDTEKMRDLDEKWQQVLKRLKEFLGLDSRPF